MNDARTPWIHSAPVDSIVLLGPPFFAVAIAWIFRARFDGTTDVPLWVWIGAILAVDVAHVYGTLFRTYLSPVEWNARRALLVGVPLACWLVGVLLFSIHPLAFWSVLAYVAVFHFARQQYGFVRLYSRGRPGPSRWTDGAIIACATGYPIVYWHTRLPRNFHWFVDGDFLPGLPPVFATIAAILYAVVAIVYVAHEARLRRESGTFNFPKQMVVLGTALSWYVGIVALNGDLAFTIVNVLAHGVPYLGLVWLAGRRRGAIEPEHRLLGGIPSHRFFTVRFLPVFLVLVLAFAFIEEGLWDGFVWREHLGFFAAFAWIPRIEENATLAWLVPLLALPQSTHYVLDGFIWRLRDDPVNLRNGR